MKWTGTRACVGEIKNSYKLLGRKPQEKRPVENLQIEGRVILNLILRESGWKVVDWINLISGGLL
jgi:hypothetical protein